ncbi:hypothetical protein ACPCB7_23320 [Streptomyces arboris]|uniref:hypothetical protein n=1 Tax=Streptomyces arboris TaxID=2600619 RepID=UPI003C2F187C
MSTAGAADRTRPAWKLWAVVAVVVVVIAGLLHAWRNTNVLTGNRLCGGLVSAEQADAVLPGSGRLDARGDGLGKELTDTVCNVEKSSVVLGSGRSFLTVEVREEQAEDLLGVDWSPTPSRTSFFSGEATGGVDAYTGWVLLPEKCWTDRPVIVRTSTNEPVPDRTSFAALTTGTAREIAARATCGDLPQKPGPLLAPVSDEARPVTEGQACGLDGFSVGGQVPTGTKVLEAGQKAPAGLWSCKLTLDDDSRGPIRTDGFMTYTASQDPLLIAALRKTPDASRGRAPDGRAADVVKPQAMVLPCAEGGHLYVASQSGMQYMESRDRGADLPARDAYFAPFMKAAAKSFGCAAPAAG